MGSAFLLLFASLVAIVSGQILSDPVRQWVTSIPPANYGNSVTMSPDGTLAIFTGAEGSVTALNTADGSFAWQFTPDLDTTVFSNSGITISSSEEFFVVGISGGFEQVDPSYCTVYSITFDGTATAFPTLDGQCSGTPLLSSDDSYVFLTHNLAASGTFSILDVASTSLYFSNTDDTQPYSPPGIYFNPSEGYYPGGEGNPNDILVWAYTPTADEQGVGTGATFAFQFPIGFFDGFDASGLFITTVNDNVNWQAIAPPKLTNFGYSMYFSVSRSQWRGWVGAPGDLKRRFNRGASNSRGYSRGDPVWQAIFAPLALSSSTETPMLFGGTASTLFVGFDFEMNEMWQLATTFPVYSEAKVSPDDTVVYFVEQNGIAQAVSTNGTSIFNFRIAQAPITADFALTESGRIIIVIDEAGNAQAIQVAEATTEAPVTRLPIVPTVTAPAAPSSPSSFPINDPASNNGTVPEDAPSPPDLPPGFLIPGEVENLTTFDVVTNIAYPPLVWLTALVVATPAAVDIIDDPSATTTLFVPSDKAFLKTVNLVPYLGESYLDDLVTLEWSNHRLCALAAHLISDQIFTSSMFQGQRIPTALEYQVQLNDSPDFPTVNQIPISQKDVVTNNGLIHVVDESIILPPCIGLSIYEQGQAQQFFTLLIQLVGLAGLAETLTVDRPITLLAPTDDAFARLNTARPGLLDYLLSDTGELSKFVSYHIIPAMKFFSNATSDVGEYNTGMESATINVAFVEGQFVINQESSILGNDILAQNGLITVVDTVLIPPGLTLPPSQAPVPAPSAAPTLAPVSAPTGAPVSPVVEPTPAPLSGPTTAAPTAPIEATAPLGAPTSGAWSQVSRGIAAISITAITFSVCV